MGNNRLGKKTRSKLRKYFTKCIKHHAKSGILSTAEQDEGAAELKQSLMASLYHSLKIDDLERRHHFCPPGESWCAHKRGAEVVDKDHHLHACFEELLLPLYERYTSRPMLNKLLAGLTTNDLEAFNSTIWNRLPKSKFHGQKRVETVLMLCIVE